MSIPLRRLRVFATMQESRGIVLYNPQQNEVSERKNRSITGVAKAMLHDHEFLIFLWVLECNSLVYHKNRSTHTVLGDTTLEEAFTGVKP